MALVGVASFVGGEWMKDVEAVDVARVEKMDRVTSLRGRVAILQEVVGHIGSRGPVISLAWWRPRISLDHLRDVDPGDEDPDVVHNCSKESVSF